MDVDFSKVTPPCRGGQWCGELLLQHSQAGAHGTQADRVSRGGGGMVIWCNDAMVQSGIKHCIDGFASP